MNFIAIQYYVKAKKLGTRIETTSMILIKLIDDRLQKNNFSCYKEVETFIFEVEYKNVEISIHVFKEVTMKGA